MIVSYYTYHTIADIINIIFIIIITCQQCKAGRGEIDVHPISQKTPAPQYQPINIKKRKKILVETKRDIIIIKRGWQCKAGRERLTPYQSEDPNPTTPTHRKKEEREKTVGDKK